MHSTSQTACFLQCCYVQLVICVCAQAHSCMCLVLTQLQSLTTCALDVNTCKQTKYHTVVHNIVCVDNTTTCPFQFLCVVVGCVMVSTAWVPASRCRRPFLLCIQSISAWYLSRSGCLLFTGGGRLDLAFCLSVCGARAVWLCPQLCDTRTFAPSPCSCWSFMSHPAPSHILSVGTAKVLYSGAKADHLTPHHTHCNTPPSTLMLTLVSFSTRSVQHSTGASQSRSFLSREHRHRKALKTSLFAAAVKPRRAFALPFFGSALVLALIRLRGCCWHPAAARPHNEVSSRYIPVNRRAKQITHAQTKREKGEPPSA